jgi:hypothetical protein
MADQLNEIADSLAALKGLPYAQFVAGVFSISDMTEVLIANSTLSADLKDELGASANRILAQICSASVAWVCASRHPNFAELPSDKRAELRHKIIQEMRADNEMFAKKHREL